MYTCTNPPTHKQTKHKSTENTYTNILTDIHTCKNTCWDHFSPHMGPCLFLFMRNTLSYYIINFICNTICTYTYSRHESGEASRHVLESHTYIHKNGIHRYTIHT